MLIELLCAWAHTLLQVVSAVLERLDVPAISDLYQAIIALHSPRVLYALSSASEKLVLFIMVRGGLSFLGWTLLDLEL